MMAGNPVIVLREGAEETSHDDARRRILQGAGALSDSLRSTLGPRGLDKLLLDSGGGFVITNDGAAIVAKMEIEDPAARLLAELAKAQDQECGDGTKSSVILAGELLRRAGDLLDEHVHPVRIADGYLQAESAAVNALEAVGRPVHPSDTGSLTGVAACALVSKGVSGARALLAPLAVRTVLAVGDPVDGTFRFDRRNVQMVKRPGEHLELTELVEGHVIDAEPVRPDMPKFVEPARIAVVGGAIEIRKTEYSAEIRITEPEQEQRFLDEEARLLDAAVESVVASGANVLVCGKGIDDRAAERLAGRGVYAVRQVSERDRAQIVRASRAREVARPEELTAADLGQAGRVEVRKTGEKGWTLLTRVPNARSVALLLRGGSEHVVDELERSMIDAVSAVGLALTSGGIVTGAGASYLEMTRAVRTRALNVGGREQLAMAAYADALEVIPRTLAQNAGLDPLDAFVRLRQAHAAGERDVGVDGLRGVVADMATIAPEPIGLPRQILRGATETAVMLLRIDDVIAARKSPGKGPRAGASP